MPLFRKYRVGIFVLLVLAIVSINESASAFSIVSPVVQVTKPLFKSALTRLKNFLGFRTITFPEGIVPEYIILSVNNGGARFIRYAKRFNRQSLGLTARAGKDIRYILCSQDLNRAEKIKVLNGMKAKIYLSSAGGVKKYKTLDAGSRKSQRTKATDEMNDLIEKSIKGISDCKKLLLANSN